MDPSKKRIQNVKDYEVTPSKSTSKAIVSSSNPPTPQRIPQKALQMNRFSPLQITPEIPYNTVLASNIPKPANVQIPNSPEVHKYLAKDWHEDCGMTPFTDYPASLTQKDFIRNRFSVPSLNWDTDDRSKDQRYYELILIDTDSVEITHNYDKSKAIEFSKCVIKRILTLPVFGGESIFKSFPINHPAQGYNYEDYKNAWFRAFLLRPFNHSWFFTFHQSYDKQPPIWFVDWWKKFGSSAQIIPQEVQKGFHAFAESSTLKSFQKFIMFHAKFKIPWIFAWDFNFEKIYPDPIPFSLTRVYKIKWWSRFQNHIGAEAAVKHFFTTGEKITFQRKTKGKIKDEEAKKASSSKSKSIPSYMDLPDKFKEEFFEFLAHKSASSKTGSDESVSSDPIGGQDPFEY